ncbi:MAG: GNAT family N-acetyltransferase [Planctomycetales bacterium]|nr:GNAT family N-acetyltransferase [Planctomycetales bacterium]
MSQVRLEPMTAAQFAEFLEVILPLYIAARSVADQVSLVEAERFARNQHQKLLPAGQFTPGHQFHSIVASDVPDPVGGVWFHIDAEKRQAFLYNIAVFPQWQRRGFATSVLPLVEEVVRSAGCRVLALNVFAENAAAADLYRKSGYSTVASHMNKRL